MLFWWAFIIQGQFINIIKYILTTLPRVEPVDAYLSVELFLLRFKLASGWLWYYVKFSPLLPKHRGIGRGTEKQSTPKLHDIFWKIQIFPAISYLLHI